MQADRGLVKQTATNLSRKFWFYIGQKFPGTQFGPKKSWFKKKSHEYTWCLNNMGLKCTCSFIDFFSINIYYSTTQPTVGWMHRYKGWL